MKRKHLNVEDLMSTAVISLKETDTLGRAHLEMHVATIRHIPVVDDRNHVVGILSNRDLIGAIATRQDTGVPVAELMTRSVRTVRQGLPAHQAAEILLEEKIGSLLVVGDDEQLVGIVTETDFLSVAHKALQGVLPRERGQDA